jgi:hypothetical protein
MIAHMFDTAWHRRTPLLDGMNNRNKKINIHLIDVNSRNGWNLTEPLSRLDRWVPWIVIAGTLITVGIVKWWM